MILLSKFSNALFQDANIATILAFLSIAAAAIIAPFLSSQRTVRKLGDKNGGKGLRDAVDKAVDNSARAVLLAQDAASHALDAKATALSTHRQFEAVADVLLQAVKDLKGEEDIMAKATKITAPVKKAAPTKATKPVSKKPPVRGK